MGNLQLITPDIVLGKQLSDLFNHLRISVESQLKILSYIYFFFKSLFIFKDFGFPFWHKLVDLIDIVMQK